MFKYSLDNKRYHTLNYYYRHKFGRKTFKVPLDASFTCPNKATGGCIFCSNNSKSNITEKAIISLIKRVFVFIFCIP